MSRYKLGDKIVENGRVYKIFKVEDTKSEENNKTVFFKPVYDEGTGLIGSIPMSNMDNGEFRAPSTVAEINEILKMLSRRFSGKVKVDTDRLDEKLKDNTITSCAKVANLLWIDKHNDDTTFSPTKRRLFKKAVRAVSEEYANAKETSIEKAEEKIQSYLSKAA